MSLVNISINTALTRPTVSFGRHDGTIGSLRTYGKAQLIRAMSNGKQHDRTGENHGIRIHSQLWGGQEDEKKQVLIRNVTSNSDLMKKNWFRKNISTKVSLTPTVVDSMLKITSSKEKWYSKEIQMKHLNYLNIFFVELIEELCCRLDEHFIEYTTMIGANTCRVPSKLILDLLLKDEESNTSSTISKSMQFPKQALYVNKKRGNRILHSWKNKEPFSLKLRYIQSNEKNDKIKENQRKLSLRSAVEGMLKSVLNSVANVENRTVITLTLQAGNFVESVEKGVLDVMFKRGGKSGGGSSSSGRRSSSSSSSSSNSRSSNSNSSSNSLAFNYNGDEDRNNNSQIRSSSSSSTEFLVPDTPTPIALATLVPSVPSVAIVTRLPPSDDKYQQDTTQLRLFFVEDDLHMKSESNLPSFADALTALTNGSVSIGDVVKDSRVVLGSFVNKDEDGILDVDGDGDFNVYNGSDEEDEEEIQVTSKRSRNSRNSRNVTEGVVLGNIESPSRKKMKFNSRSMLRKKKKEDDDFKRAMRLSKYEHNKM